MDNQPAGRTASKRSRPLYRSAIGFVIVGGILYLLYGAMIYAMQTALIFPAGGSVWRTPKDAPFRWPFEDVTLHVDGQTTHAWWIPLEPARGAILLSHGNGGTIADRLEQIAMFRDAGFSVFAYDYGGFGNSSGTPSETRCYADGRAAWGYLTGQRNVEARRIVLYGESLGGGVSVELAQTVQPGAVVLQNTFLSVADVARELFPIVPVSWFIKHRFDNAAKIGNVKAPILVIHSPEDTVIPFHHGKRLFEIAPEPKSFLELRGDHNDEIFTSEAEYRRGLREFLHPLFPLNT
jgi:hypothetical protein